MLSSYPSPCICGGNVKFTVYFRAKRQEFQFTVQAEQGQQSSNCKRAAMPMRILITESYVSMEMPFAFLPVYPGRKTGKNSVLIQCNFLCIYLPQQYFMLKGQNLLSLTLQSSVGYIDTLLSINFISFTYSSFISISKMQNTAIRKFIH